ncbi:hypothetical protein AFM11_03625 [Mycolicibacterium wolinskyi]|uniref:PknH-like extracellular domain-containing protein n=1 Tax=Mycolicibacterium wolinskyi TaxID=59750 RepID=A0A132PSV1_9MYCO|nr:sensor domain-containing protein [Mycolicibacterium wolinskyi]KWX25375.1 hypothetical protein AFM11_03625 [Mycolicibacterium wolinskyi]
MTQAWYPVPKPPKKSSTGRTVGLVAAALVALIAVVALVIWGVQPRTVDGQAAAVQAGGPVVDDSDLEGLLLSPDEISDIVKLPGMVTVASWMNPDAADDPGSYDPLDCLGAMYSGMSVVYDENGYEAIFQTRTGPSNKKGLPAVDQSVATFESANAAQSALGDYIELWKSCAEKKFTYTGPDARESWTLGTPESNHDGMTTLQNAMDGEQLYLDRAVAARGNVLVEVQLQDAKPAGAVVAIAQGILDRIGD